MGYAMIRESNAMIETRALLFLTRPVVRASFGTALPSFRRIVPRLEPNLALLYMHRPAAGQSSVHFVRGASACASASSQYQRLFSFSFARRGGIGCSAGILS